jgi:hypothetical protein
MEGQNLLKPWLYKNNYNIFDSNLGLVTFHEINGFNVLQNWSNISIVSIYFSSNLSYLRQNCEYNINSVT